MAPSRRRRDISMTDIARAAGVSVTTVSHVVNQTRPVAESTEKAVQAAMAELGYVPLSVARNERAVGPHTIGIALSSITNPSFGEVVGPLERAATASGYTILLADTHDSVGDEFRAVSDLATRRVDAIVLAPSAEPEHALRLAVSKNVPVVLVDRTGPTEFDQVVVSNAEPTAQLIDHLAELGHTRIAMVCPRRGLTTSEERLDGYRDGMTRNSLPVDETLIVDGDGQMETARTAALQLLDGPKPPTAIVVGNNQMTIGVMTALRDRELRVPNDIALVAFDDFPWADLFHPRLTTIAQPTQSLGSEAMRMTLARIADPQRPPEKLVLQPRLVHRDSCGCGLRAPAGPALASTTVDETR